MAKYTTSVRTICEFNGGYEESVGYNDVNDVIEKARQNIFSFKYPIFDQSYKALLETKILKHYYTREIGFETVGLWKLKLDTKMNEIMPYYNQLYESTLLEFNPLYDVYLERTHNVKGNTDKNEIGDNVINESQNGSVNVKGTRDDYGSQIVSGTTISDSSHDGRTTGVVNSETSDVSESKLIKKGENTSTNTGTVKNENGRTDKYSDTPQGEITNLNSSKYLTNARVIDDDSTTTNNLKTLEEINTTDTTTGNNINKHKGDNVSTTHSDENGSVKSDSDTDTTFSSDTRNDTISNSTKTGNTSTSVNSTITSLEEYTEKVKGKQGGKNYSEMLQDFRNTFLNIDMQVINELSDLFMLIW